MDTRSLLVNTFEEAAQIMMRRVEALRAYCADPTNTDDVALRGAKLAVHHLARIRERDRNATKHALDYPGPRTARRGIGGRHLHLQGDPTLG